MKTIDVAGCVGTTALLLLASTYIPFGGGLFSLLTPLPIIYYATKLGIDQGVKLVGLTLLFAGLIAALTRHVHFLFLCVEFSLLGLVIADLFRRRLSIGYTVLIGTGLTLLIGFVLLAAAGLSENKAPREMVLSYLQGGLGENLEFYKGAETGQENAFNASEYLRFLIDTIMKIYPALTVIGTGFVVWVNVMIGKSLLRRRNLPYPDFGSMDRWGAPESMVWGLIGAGFALFLPWPSLRSVALNAVMVFLVIYFFHGLSILVFYHNKYRVPSWIRLGVYALILFQQIFAIVVAFAGLFDQWIDLRRIHPKKKEIVS
jgi:uncharacterized protein YybS (DUF2232 family)